LANLLRAQARAADSAAQQRNVIFIYQGGGPSHLETWDPKPEAPSDYRGEFDTIATSLPGYRVGQYMPNLAKLCDRLAILRTVYHNAGDHGEASHVYMTGYRPLAGTPKNEAPSTGSIVSKELGPRPDSGLPAYIATRAKLPSGAASYLGMQHDPFQTFGDPSNAQFKVRNLQPPESVDSARLANRRAMMAQFDRFQRETDASRSMDGMDDFARKAIEIATSPQVQKAFDLNNEPAALREKYGRQGGGPQSTLLARRLIEAGARYVTVRVDGAWDTHSNNFTGHRALVPPWDLSVAALIDDLEDRGLFDTTLLVIGGEFGRTPKINKSAGRDHWPSAFSVVLAGGGLKEGIIVGQTDALAELPKDRPIRYQDVLATIYHQLGIDWHKTYLNDAGRPVPIVNDGEPISEIIA
jgi:hypothetical protein